MSGNFSEKSLKVLAIESSGAVRQLLTDTIRSVGFEDVTGVPSIKDALSTMEVEPVGWVIAPLMAEEEANGLNLLRTITEYPGLKSARVSLLLEEEELPKVGSVAFSLGMMNWFEKPFNKDSISKGMNEMFERFEKLKWDTTLLSSTYIFDYLATIEGFEKQVEVSKEILGLYPGNVDVMLQLARAYYGTKNTAGWKHIINQVKIIAPSREEEIVNFQKEFLAEEEGGEEMGAPEGEEESSTQKILNIKSAIVIDPDQGTNDALVEILTDLGCEKTDSALDGKTAWQWLECNEPELILMEWRLPELTGPLLLQRIREKLPNVPIIVSSGLLEEQDFPLLSEMGVAAVLPKPYDRSEVVKFIIHTIQQDKLPTEIGSLERKIRQHFKSGELSEAENLRPKYVALPDLSDARKSRLFAEFSYHHKKYEEARDYAADAMRRSSDSIQMLNLLGKIFLKLGDSAAAIRCFEKAQNLSPMNISRLCEIAQIHSEQGNHDAAKEAVEGAQDMDAENEKVQETATKVALSSGDTESAKAIMNQLDSINEVVSYMNNRAVALAQIGEKEAAFELYEKTLESIPDSKKELIPVVMYNVALGYIRASEYVKAAEKLKETVDLGASRVQKKSESLLARVQQAIEKGTEIRLNNSAQAEAKKSEEGKEDGGVIAIKPKEEHKETLSAIIASAGEICCYKIFHTDDSKEEIVTKMLGHKVRFVPRGAIERAESFGADRAAKA